MMRVVILALAVWFAAAPALADSDVSFHVDLGASSASYGYGVEWAWGDTVLTGGLRYYQNGLTVVAGDGDWGAYYSAGAPYYYAYPYGYPYAYGQPVTYAQPVTGSYYQPLTPYESLITPYESLVTPYESQIGVPYNDRGGYRVFIPRGRGGAPELYGDYATNNYQPSARAITPYTSRRAYYPRRYRHGHPLVINYSLGYQYYTAPAYRELGYAGGMAYDPRYVDSRGYGQGTPGESRIYAGEVNIYEGNVYYSDSPGQPQQVAPATAPAPVPPAVEVAPGPMPAGLRFYTRAILELPAGVLCFELDGSRLTAGPEAGPAQLVATDVNAAAGVFAAYVPGDGVSLIFRQGSMLLAAYLESTGDWWLEPLPIAVDFSENLTIGMVGGFPWVAFSAVDNTRYVFSFSCGQWVEIGSGTTGE